MRLSKEELATMGFKTQTELMRHLVITQPDGEKIMPILEDPKLFDRITIEEFDKTIGGEYDTRRALFLMLCGAWVENLQSMVNSLINSESSSGKSYLGKAVTKILPADILVYRTKITPEAFTYWHNAKFEPDWTWNGKVLYLEDVKESILNSDTLKVMCSEGSISTIVKNQMTFDIIINGKPIIIMTTASYTPNNEILNRFNLLVMDETDEQTKNIIQRQSKIAKGESEYYDPFVIVALSKLNRIKVRIPFAQQIDKVFPNDAVRNRRDYPKFLDLIKCSVALHQFQRNQDEDGCFLAQEQDYELAREVINKIRDSGGDTGLPYRLKKAFGYCIELLKEFPDGFTATDIFLKYPYLAKRNWYETLDKISERGLLIVREEKREESKKPVTIYKPKPLKKHLDLPSFIMLINDTNDIKDTNVIKDTNDGIFSHMQNMASFTSFVPEKEKVIDDKIGKLLNDVAKTFVSFVPEKKAKMNSFSDYDYKGLPKVRCEGCGLNVFEDDFNKNQGCCRFCEIKQERVL